MSKQKVGETVNDSQFTWNTYYDSATDQFETRWSDGQGNSGITTDSAGMQWPFGADSFWK